MTGIREALGSLGSAADDARMLQEGTRWHTWGEVRSIAEAVDSALKAVGCNEGSRIGAVLGNRVESVATLIAVLGQGRTIITLNPMQPPARVTADAIASAPQVVLAPRSFWDEAGVRDAIDEAGIVGFAVDGTDVVQRTGGQEAGGPVVRDEADPVAVEMFTSGTTGPPKRIPLTWRQLEASLDAVHGHTGKGGEKREPLTGRVSLVSLSIVHIGGLWGVIQALAEARPIVMLPRFTVDGWVNAVHEHQLRVAGLPPAAMRSVLNAGVPREKLSSLRAVTAGTTFVSPDLADEFTETYGVPVMIMYGATEFGGAVAGWTKPLLGLWWERKRGSVGRPFPGVTIRTVGDTGEILPPNATGRIEVNSSQTGTGTDQWLRTSDLGHLDEDGFLYIDGRADDAIIRGGFKVQPETVCNALRAHPAVLDASVYGRDDERLGQVPVAVIELAGGVEPIDEAELKEFVRTQLTGYEVPVTIHTVEALPRSVSLKIDRRRLLEMVADIESANA